MTKFYKFFQIHATFVLVDHCISYAFEMVDCVIEVLDIASSCR
jgi:hypothetical protein